MFTKMTFQKCLDPKNGKNFAKKLVSPKETTLNIQFCLNILFTALTKLLSFGFLENNSIFSHLKMSVKWYPNIFYLKNGHICTKNSFT